MVTRQIKHKQDDGSEVTLDIGALAANVETDESHQFVTQEEKNKVKDIEKIKEDIKDIQESMSGSESPDIFACMHLYGGTALDPKGTTKDEKAQYDVISLSTAAKSTVFSKNLTDLPKGMYSVMLRMKISQITSGANVFKVSCGEKNFYIKPKMFQAANTYQTLGFTVENVSGTTQVSLAVDTVLAGQTAAVDYPMIAPAFTAISSVT